MRGIGADRQVRYARLLGLTFAVAGFIAIGVGWNGMARVACVDCQMPYLLSGGAAGVGLILFGTGLLVSASIRDERLKSEERIRELIQVTGRVGGALAAQTESPDGLVVAGRSTYHRPDCRLVKDKDLDKVTVRVAAASGLTPCRVCSPETVDEGEGATEARTGKEPAGKNAAGKEAGPQDAAGKEAGPQDAAGKDAGAEDAADSAEAPTSGAAEAPGGESKKPSGRRSKGTATSE